jgi:excisionase family DNA binding protein
MCTIYETTHKCFICTQLDGFSCVILVVVAAEDWITQEEAAQKLHIALDTMRRWVRLGHFPRTKVGKRYLIPLKAIDDFLQSRLEYGARPVTPRKQAAAKKPKALRKSPPN